MNTMTIQIELSTLLYFVGTLIILSIAITLIRNVFRIDVDSTDKDTWNRSGLKIYVDSKTGIQYLSTSQGGLFPRVNVNNGVLSVITQEVSK